MTGIGRQPATLVARWSGDVRASAAVEFAILAPVLGIILAGAVDLGGVVFTKFRIENAVSAGANYALVNATKISSANGSDLATKISAVIASSGSEASDTNTVIVNHGPSATHADGNTTNGGTAANADSCYCPTASAGVVTWGSAISCGTACTGGGFAGKFISITATRDYTPFFSNYGIIGDDGAITVNVMVQAQ
jgi:Flp pilus assembly protein TadG